MGGSVLFAISIVSVVLTPILVGDVVARLCARRGYPATRSLSLLAAVLAGQIALGLAIHYDVLRASERFFTTFDEDSLGYGCGLYLDAVIGNMIEDANDLYANPTLASVALWWRLRGTGRWRSFWV